VRKIAVRCDRCQDRRRSRFRTLYDAFWCDPCNEAVRHGATVEMSIEEREARLEPSEEAQQWAVE
jgi:hypothetical protein